MLWDLMGQRCGIFLSLWSSLLCRDLYGNEEAVIFDFSVSPSFETSLVTMHYALYDSQQAQS
jgi:hypothetical protein